MERVDFIERIKHRDLLKNDSLKDWSALAAKYPYASIVQLLYQQKVDKADRKALSLFFEHPIHLNKLLQDKNVKTAVVAEQMAPKVAAEKTNEKSLDRKELEKANLITEKNKDVTLEPTIKAEKISEKEDVLELINKFPDVNPLKKATLDFSPKEETPTPTAEKPTEPQHLMVMMSFTDWLNFYKTKSENEAADKKGRDAIRSAWQKEKLAEAMDDEEDVVPDDIFEKAMKSVSFGDNLVTEPLAELYAKQGKIDKAIELYKKLSLLNPEKRTYFASKIKNLHL